LFKSDKLELFLSSIFGELTFADLPMPFRCVAVNLYDGRLVELSSGSIAKALRASCSVPGIFSPTPFDDQLLVDGGILNSVPADILKKMGADYRVAINLNADRGKFIPPKSGMDVLWSAMKIAWNANAFKSLQNVDMVIAPDLSSFNHYEIKNFTRLLEVGEQAARTVIERIAKDSRKWKWFF
jgi:NTE family protein